MSSAGTAKRLIGPRPRIIHRHERNVQSIGKVSKGAGLNQTPPKGQGKELQSCQDSGRPGESGCGRVLERGSEGEIHPRLNLADMDIRKSGEAT
jgi:hypothetical protein